jgi:hypothetical protein
MVTISLTPMPLLGSGKPGLSKASLLNTGLSKAGVRNAGLLSGGELAGRENAREVIPSGFAAVDRLLPAGGVRRGSLLEWLAAGDTAGDVAGGAGAVSLALAVACRLAAAGPRLIVVVDRAGWFHPPAVLPWLGDSRQLVVARPSTDDDEIWAIDQALRCHGVAAVVAWPRAVVRHQGSTTPPRAGLPVARGGGRPRPTAQWTTAMRRWQLAARSSGAVGLLVRPAATAGEPSWAEARLTVAPLPGGTLFERRLRLERVGGAWSGAAESQAAETVLDLARGREGSPARGAARELATRRPHERSSRWSAGGPAAGEGGVSCRAS